MGRTIFFNLAHFRSRPVIPGLTRYYGVDIQLSYSILILITIFFCSIRALGTQCFGTGSAPFRVFLFATRHCCRYPSFLAEEYYRHPSPVRLDFPRELSTVAKS
ncbi:hypothetical protein P170DRAFT_104182 [Aspergillus steynii IBT 23096]|uniref:Uncharacterized protein n=1 Tax=Aspergillus steynii IBT 23096 TaxID=1392250 RepID=A0A2I2GHV4_9EURO|nr:uncharacterized protein P170DRAFT_104182 [Aspergillus steynii IBT 23096]PLB52427.1 hypothetical protein P170DRAFT_104182 [Aspergillus steynii IBT 23096]